MPAYPSYPRSLGSSMEPEPRHQDDLSDSGGHHSRLFHDTQYYLFELVHTLTLAEYNSLMTTYQAGPRDIYTLTYWTSSPSVSYNVKFMRAPSITQNHGDGLFEVRTVLRGS